MICSTRKGDNIYLQKVVLSAQKVVREDKSDNPTPVRVRIIQRVSPVLVFGHRTAPFECEQYISTAAML